MEALNTQENQGTTDNSNLQDQVPADGTREQQVADLLAKLPDFGEGSDPSDLRKLLKLVDPDTATEAIARAFIIEPSERARQEREAALRRLDHVQSVHSVLIELSKKMSEQKAAMQKLLTTTLVLGSADMLDERKFSFSQSNSMIAHYDELSTVFCEQAGFLYTLIYAGEKYTKAATKVYDSLQQAQHLQQKEIHLNKLDEHIAAYADLINDFYTRSNKLAIFARDIIETTGQQLDRIATKFSSESEKKETGTSVSIFDLLAGRDPTQRIDVPIYKNNPYLTAYLYDLANKIPDLSDEQKENEKKLTKIPEVKLFIETITHNADPIIYGFLADTSHYSGAAEALKALHQSFQLANLALQQSHVRETLKDTRLSVRATYERVADQVKAQIPGQEYDHQGNHNFNPRQAADYLNSITSVKVRKEELPKSSKKRRSRFDQAWLDLYEKLDELVVSLISKQAGRTETETFVKELLQLKSKTSNPKDRTESAALKKSIDQNNFAFTVTKEGYDELQFERVPTGNHKFSDLIGSSWENVEQTIESLLDYSMFSGLYTEMTKRGRVNNNVLVAGPAGCGKNMFLRVLQSDQRVISVNMTTDRVMSMWQGKSEGNIRDLFELSYKQRLRQDKPVAIGWDEIDALFVRKNRAGGTTTSEGIALKQQKILQSVLDGDTFYEGVSLIGFTNEPQHVPHTVFRRFANLVVIQPLTEQERKTLIEDLLSGLPMHPDFGRLATWDDFLAKTGSAHGDVIGKVFDKVYGSYVATLKLEYNEQAHKINQVALEIKEDGEKLTQERRREIFTEHVPDHVVTPEDFKVAYDHVLGEKDVQGAMKAQDLFYHNIEQMLEEAFE